MMGTSWLLTITNVQYMCLLTVGVFYIAPSVEIHTLKDMFNDLVRHG